jgi:outer membrane murein-binding lipoprotein Lpp
MAGEELTMRRSLAACVLAFALLAGCGGTAEDEPAAPADTLDASIPPAPAGTVDERCAQLSQEVLDAYNRGDREAEEAAVAEFDRLAEAGECDR